MVDWISIKNFIDTRKVSPQWLDINNHYYISAFDGSFNIGCILPKTDPASEEQLEFETGYKSNGNKTPKSEVVTQYEKDDKTLKLCRAVGYVGEDGSASIYIKVPGQFGSGQGRYVVGGYGISADYDPDDYCSVFVEDKDRIIAWMIAQSQNPNASAPVSDATVIAIGEIPGIGIAFPSYPLIRSYTDNDCPTENQGWYFWPLATGTNTPPVGEIEVNPIGGYGFLPSGFYLKLVYQRPQGKTTGAMRANIDWGKEQ